MSKSDIKLLITGVISLFLAFFMAVVTIITFATSIGSKITEVDWQKNLDDIRVRVEQTAP